MKFLITALMLLNTQIATSNATRKMLIQINQKPVAISQNYLQ